MQKLLILFWMILFSASLYAQKEIKLSNALKHVGDSVTLTGWITGVRFLSNASTPTLFLKMNAEKPGQNLIAMVMSDYNARLSFEIKNALNKPVLVKGVIRLLQGKPMLVVRSEQQITVLQRPFPTPTIYKH